MYLLFCWCRWVTWQSSSCGQRGDLSWSPTSSSGIWSPTYSKMKRPQYTTVQKCYRIFALCRMCVYFQTSPNCDHRTLDFYTGHAHLLILSLTLLRVQLQLSGTDCLSLLVLLIALVSLDLDLKLTYLQKPLSPNVSVTQRLWFGSRCWRFINCF